MNLEQELGLRWLSPGRLHSILLLINGSQVLGDGEAMVLTPSTSPEKVTYARNR